MKNMKKLVAALLVLSLTLALTATAFAAPKFTKDQAASGLFVKFNSNVYGYNKPLNSTKSKTIVRKGSVGLLVELKGSKWGKVVLTDGTMNMLGKTKELWFGVDRIDAVEDQDNAFISVTFAAGGSGMSVLEGKPTNLKALKGKKIQTTGKVKLRKTSSLAGKSCGTIQKGKKLTCTGKICYDSRFVVFFQVKQGGKNYWVSAEYIKDWAKILVDALLSEEGI